MTVEAEAGARASAFALVEDQLLGPVALVTGATARLYTDEQGTVMLPFQPAFNVQQVAYDTGSLQDLSTITVDGQVVSGLPRLLWVTVTYDHGWADPDVPPIVRTIIDQVQARLMRTPDDNIRAETVGGYRVEFVAAPAWLTPDEKEALSKHLRVVDGVTASPSTTRVGPAFAPAFWGEGFW